MSAIGPGDFVECVNPGVGPKGELPHPWLALSAVYQVAEVDTHPQRGTPVLFLVGMPKGGDIVEGHDNWPRRYFGSGVWRFRPIYTRDESLLTRLMAPISEDADVSGRVFERATADGKSWPGMSK